MATATLQKEIKILKQRQTRLERMVHEALSRRLREAAGEELRPEYVRRLRRIVRDMRAGKDVTVVHTGKELKRFFRGL
jgi:predicted  nucleic acid-binding Zn-ribbon protein